MTWSHGFTALGREPSAARFDRARLLIVSNRLPVTLRREGTALRADASVGGLATGLQSTHARRNSLWIGWPGDGSDVDEPLRTEARRHLAGLRMVPIALSAHERRVFYERLCNGILWPVVHDRLDRLPLRVDGWRTYERVNARFAAAIAAVWQPGDVVWIHDYHLMRVPALLRARCPDARIGFFLHTPFPNPEVFLALPVREWLVSGLLGADLIGFHTRRYRGHFSAVLRRLLQLEMDADGHVRHAGRAIQLGVFPMGVDARALDARSSAPGVAGRIGEFKRTGERLLVGVDRLDYSKGTARRLASVERLLAHHSEWRERVRLVQVAVPSRTGVAAYEAFRTEVEALVGAINGRFGTPTWTPIQYIERAVTGEPLYALYRAADVMLVTPLRDGMNLVAKEFVACRRDEDGVLILSEFAGAADGLAGALIVNPYDVDGVADAIHRGLGLGRDERRRRMRQLREHVFEDDVHDWARSFLSALAGSTAPAPFDRERGPL